MEKEVLIKKDLIDILHNRFGLSQADCKLFVDSIFQEILNTLAKGEPVKISSFGTFQVKFRASQEILDINTKEERTLGPRYKVKFIPSNKLKQKVNN